MVYLTDAAAAGHHRAELVTQTSRTHRFSWAAAEDLSRRVELLLHHNDETRTLLNLRTQVLPMQDDVREVSSRPDESQQVRVEDIRMCGQHAMRVARISLQRPVLEQIDRTRH